MTYTVDDNPYDDINIEKARIAAKNLKKQFGTIKGIVNISHANHHGSLEIDVWCLDNNYASTIEKKLPSLFETFSIRIISPFWSIGELCGEGRKKVEDFGITVFGAEKHREKEKYYTLVAKEEEKKWQVMDSSQRRCFMDSLLKKRGKKNCNCYQYWREEDF